MESKIASNIAPKSNIQSLKSIMKLPIQRGCNWNVFTYVLNQDLIGEDGKIDDLRAVVFCLGSFYDKGEAENHAKAIIEKTGYTNIIVAKYGLPIPLSVNPSSDTIEILTVDMNNKIIELESDQYKRQKEAYEKKVKAEMDILNESQSELDEDNIEYYKRNVILAVKHYSMQKDLLMKAKEASQNFEKRKKILQEHLIKHPEHDDMLLPFLKEKLESRGENELYMRIETSYSELKKNLLL